MTRHRITSPHLSLQILSISLILSLIHLPEGKAGLCDGIISKRWLPTWVLNRSVTKLEKYARIIEFSPGDLVQIRMQRAPSILIDDRILEVTFQSVEFENSGRVLHSEIQSLENTKNVRPNDQRRVRERRWEPAVKRTDLRRKLIQYRDEFLGETSLDQLKSELVRFASLSAIEKNTYLLKTSREIENRILTTHGTDHFGIHFNLHGGQANDYIDGRGIRATRGDISLQYGSGSTDDRVYYYRIPDYSIYQALNDTNPAIFGPLASRTRMGSVVSLFDVGSKMIAKQLSNKQLVDHSAIFTSFPDKDGPGFHGFSTELYLMPPIELWESRWTKLIGRSLSRDEETLVALRAIELYSTQL